MAENVVKVESGSISLTSGTSAVNVAVPGPNLGAGLVVTTGMLVPATSLAAVTGNATGSIVDMGSAHSVWSVHSFGTGTLTGTVHLLVSADGVNFFDVASGTVPAAGTFASTFTVSSRYARATLTGITGSGTITSNIMAS